MSNYIEIEIDKRTASIRKLRLASEFISWKVQIIELVRTEQLLMKVFTEDWNKEQSVLRVRSKPERETIARLTEIHQVRERGDTFTVESDGSISIQTRDGMRTRLQERRLIDANLETADKLEETLAMYSSEFTRVTEMWKEAGREIHADRTMRIAIEKCLNKEISSKIIHVVNDKNCTAYKLYKKLEELLQPRTVDQKDQAELGITNTVLEGTDFTGFLAKFRESWAIAIAMGLYITGDRIWSKFRGCATKSFEGTNHHAYNAINNILMEAERAVEDDPRVNRDAFEDEESEMSAAPRWLRDRLDYLENRFHRLSLAQRESIVGIQGKNKSLHLLSNNNISETDSLNSSILSLINLLKNNNSINYTKSENVKNNPIQCYNCGKKGHKSIECRAPKTTCGKCRREGHSEAFCGKFGRRREKDAARSV